MPYGRQQIKRHPGEVVLPSTQPQLHPESFLLHRLSQVAISDTAKVCTAEVQFYHLSSIWYSLSEREYHILSVIFVLNFLVLIPV